MGKVDHASNVEAIHILMGLSRSVFEDFAERGTLSRRFEQWLMDRAVRGLEKLPGCRSSWSEQNV
jgi:hypothetical protein